MKVLVELQYFDGCPHLAAMRENLARALQGLEESVRCIVTAVADTETASKVQFRGSPTLLIDGVDLEGMPPPEQASLSCRLYPNGVPTAEAIRARIIQASTKG